VEPNTGLHVKGAWNNHEGLDKEYESRFDQLLEKIGGYNVQIVGKTDWTAGAHSVDCMVQSWTQKVHFPYTLANHSAGWLDEDGPKCSGDDDTSNHTHSKDWEFVETVAKFVRGEGKKDPRPWYVHLGTNIVHPAYTSSKVWLDKIDESKITIPVWTPLSEMHPEDFQQTMKKHMAMDIPLQNEEYALGGSMDKWKLLVRKHYYAMIAEYDAMVCVVVWAVWAVGCVCCVCCVVCVVYVGCAVCVGCGLRGALPVLT
jgi:arylsulfatase K